MGGRRRESPHSGTDAVPCLPKLSVTGARDAWCGPVPPGGSRERRPGTAALPAHRRRSVRARGRLHPAPGWRCHRGGEQGVRFLRTARAAWDKTETVLLPPPFTRCGPSCGRCGPSCGRCGPPCGRCGPSCSRCDASCDRCGPSCSRCGPSCGRCDASCRRCDASCRRCGPSCGRCGPSCGRCDASCGRCDASCRRCGPSCTRIIAPCDGRKAPCGDRNASCDGRNASCDGRNASCGDGTAPCGRWNVSIPGLPAPASSRNPPHPPLSRNGDAAGDGRAPSVGVDAGDPQTGYRAGSSSVSGSAHLPCSRMRSTSRSTASDSGMLKRTGFLPT